MKTTTRVLTALVFFIAVIGNAVELPKINVVPVEANKALVVYSANGSTPLEITLTDCNCNVLYFKRTSDRHMNYEETIDFSALRNGKYCICFNYGNQSVSRNVMVSKNKIEVGPLFHCFEPCIKLEDKMLNISFLNQHQKQVFVNVYKDGRHIDGFKLGKKLALQKRLDLSNLPSDDYEIVISDCKKTHKFLAKL
jgi:hypothetical protein